MRAGMVGLILLAMGCKKDDAGDAPTWNADVEPLMAKHCQSCHQDGGIAPFSLGDYKSSSLIADAIVEAVESGSMPPWKAETTDECAPPLPWADDLRLTDAEKKTIRAWADAGAPEGEATDRKKKSEVPAPPTLDRVDKTVQIIEPYAVDPSNGKDDYRCFVVDPELTERKYLTGVQVDADNISVVHHVLVWTDEEDATANLITDDETASYHCFGDPSFYPTRLIGAWAPGALPFEPPEGTAVPIDPGTKIVINMHYHPQGTDVEFDQSAIEFRWEDEQPDGFAELFLMGNAEGSWGSYGGLQPGPDDEGGLEFRIPAGAEAHTETMMFNLGADIPIPLPVFAATTHMHYVGTDMRAWLEHPDGSETCLVQTPEYDFNWQRLYVYDGTVDEVPVWDPADKLWLECTYNNSLSNPFVAEALDELDLDEPQDVFLGEGTLDEMCLGVFGITYPPVDFF